MTTKHIARLPNGKTAKRVSQSRSYPYAVIAQANRAHDEAAVLQRHEGHLRNWDYYAACASTPLGEKIPGANYPNDADAQERGQEIVTEHPTRDAYAKALVKADLDRIAANAAKGWYEEWQAVTWTSRADLAAKELDKAQRPVWTGHPLRINARIVETERS